MANDAAGPDAPQEAPPVVAVIVVKDPGPWFEECLATLAGQDYPALSILVIDAGSAVDPTARVAAAVPSAFVRRLTGDTLTRATEVRSTVEQQLGDLRTEVTKLVAKVEDALAPVAKDLEARLDEVEARLPEQARTVVSSARSLLPV